MSIPVVLGEQMQISASAISRSDFSEYIILRNCSGQWMGPVGALERQTFRELWILSYGFSLRSVRISLFVCMRVPVFFFPLCDINPLYLLL